MDEKEVESLFKKSILKHQKLFAIKLEDLPVEVLLKVFNFLELIDLYRCGQVSKRLKSVSLVESLWQKVILLNNTRPEKTTVSINLVEKMLDRGCKTLCLKRCKITGAYLRPIFDDHLLVNYIKIDEKLGPSQLIHLDLYQCEFTNDSLETLLSSSHSLKKLSLTEHNINLLDYDILRTFYSQNGQTLQTLNLAFTRVVSFEHIELIVKHCTGLKEVDFSDCCLSSLSVNFLVEGITKNIEKFGLAYCGLGRSAIDHYINILVSRCIKIKSLNIALNSITDETLTSIMENLKNTLEELDIGTCCNITDSKLLEMKSMPKLKVLNYFNPWDSNYEDLKNNLPQLNYNLSM